MFGTFIIYASDGTTPLPIPQPQRATWERPQVGTFLDGTPRMAARAVVEWQFGSLTLAQYQQLIATRPARGLVTISTYRAGEVNPPQMAKCRAIMAPVVQGQEMGGNTYAGVTVQFTAVVQL